MRFGFWVLGCLALALGASPPGRVLDAVPPIAPGGVTHAPAPSLREAVSAYDAGDHRRARSELEAWLDAGTAPWGRERMAGRFLLGWLYMQDGRWNLASSQFTQVRAGGTPLAEDAAWYEAYTDLQRGRATVAARECEAYREAWPEGVWRGECLLLIGRANTAVGLKSAALAAYTLYLEENPDTPREEEVRLGMILAEASTSPQKAALALRDMTLRHNYHANGVAAEQALAELVATRGVVLPPLDPLLQARMQAESLRDCGYSEEAWDLYSHIVETHGEDPEVQAWAAATADRFAWRTKQYEAVAQQLVPAYRRQPSGETAYLIYRAYSRAGLWSEAADWAETGLAQHATDWRWRKSNEQVAHANQLAGRYLRARELWDGLARSGGTVGKLARWYGAYSSFKAEDYEDALVRLSVLVDAGGEIAQSARYYRARTHEAMGNKDLARQDRDIITRGAPGSWYALLLRTKNAPPKMLRDGRWPGPPPPPDLPPAQTHPLADPSAGALRQSPPTLPEAREISWDQLIWGAVSPEPQAAPPAPPPATPSSDPYAALQHPSPYPASRFYDPSGSMKALSSFSEKWSTLWPRLPAAADYASVGLYELAAPIVSAAYEEWDDAQARRSVREAELRQAPITKGDWRPLFLAARDHHHVAKFLYGLERSSTVAPAEQIMAMRLSFPAPYLDELIEQGRADNADPLLALGIMRQESVYNPSALSHAGAMGLLQVMPNTGAKVAAMMGETRYSPAMLEQPEHNLRYGVFYLSKLLERFDGAWPLAVASYNAGPTNVSSWYRPWRGKIRMDDFVEQIPLNETRDYVKNVGEYYAVYAMVWGPEGAEVRVPASPGADKEEVIDF